MSLGSLGLYYGYILVCVLLILCQRIFATESNRQLCNVTRVKCSRRVGCGMALHNFYVGCNSVMDGKEGGCTKRCKSALISLLSTEDKQGSAFINCDCHGDKHCLAPKSRVEVCAKDVLSAMESINDDKTQLSCTLAQWICEADTSCFAAWNFYREHCAEFFLGTPNRCSSRCNNSLAILYRQSRAKKLRTCRCDDPVTGSICQKIKDNTERLCFNKYPQRPSSDQPGEPMEEKDRGYSYERKSQTQYNIGVLLSSSIATLFVILVTHLLHRLTTLH